MASSLYLAHVAPAALLRHHWTYYLFGLPALVFSFSRILYMGRIEAARSGLLNSFTYATRSGLSGSSFTESLNSGSVIVRRVGSSLARRSF